MESKEIFSHIDHTLLKADVSWRQIQKLAEEARKYGAASVCVPPSYVERLRREYPQLCISTVVGFPLGYTTPAVKCFAASEAVRDGANELDVVINLGDVSNRAFHRVLAELQVIREAAGRAVVKAIIETCFLDDRDKAELCRIVSAAGMDYIKTSTGFGSAGAQLSDVALFQKHLDSSVKIKAAGGIRSKEEMEAFLSAGADRLGCSNAAAVLFPQEEQAALF
ncbi:MAG: deoxyribose-phosphate aldolase [Bacillota bacterium]|nr:deoxyribose-phosphate aldolase [Bacillota bacterium]